MKLDYVLQPIYLIENKWKNYQYFPVLFEEKLQGYLVGIANFMETTEYRWNGYHSTGAEVLDKVETIKQSKGVGKKCCKVLRKN